MSKIDLFIKNANVLTLDSQNRRAGSVAVSDGKIIGIWAEGEPAKGEINLSVQTSVVDLQGATLIPGFIDTHNHILMYGELKEQLDCSPSLHKSIQDVLAVVGTKAKELPDGEWIKGFGYDDTLIIEKRHLTCEDLDQVAPHNPVIITHISGHVATVNSLALQIAGIRNDISDPPGGHFGRDEKGQLNGVLYDHAMEPITNVLPKRTVGDLVQSIRNAAQDYVAQGITTNTDAAISGKDDFEAHIQAAKKSINPMRTQLMIMHHLLNDGEIFGQYSAAQLNQEIQEKSGGRAKLDSAKLFQDGSIQAFTGALREPYYQNPDITGELIHQQEVLNKLVLDLHQRGFRIATHGNGDRAIGSILEAYSYALTNGGQRDHRHRIEHVQTATPKDIAMMQKLGVAASFFINHVYYWGDRHRQIFLGPERAKRISPLHEAVDANLLFTLHSDCPVTPISPLFSVWAAVNRFTKDGYVLGADQRIDVEKALKSMTSYGAKMNFDEDVSGSIEIGKNADFAVLEADPTTVNPVEIKDISILATYIDGRPVYGQGKIRTT
ncbi:amidohydrolase [Lysinibacillus sp. NPDC097287]|uniref:amidohydrolase n=1 Tax=Lysinibacillus sp. NPDC097287 TaxID=3364144 RepID=UPI00382DB341